MTQECQQALGETPGIEGGVSIPFQRSSWMCGRILAAAGGSCKQGLVLGAAEYPLHGQGTQVPVPSWGQAGQGQEQAGSDPGRRLTNLLQLHQVRSHLQPGNVSLSPGCPICQRALGKVYLNVSQTPER